MENIRNELSIENIFDMNIWQKIQDSFAEATGFAAIIVDKDGKPVLDYSNFRDYCLELRKTPLCETCFLSDATGGNEALIAKKPIIYQCHAGLIDFAVPIIVQGQYVGAILAGQSRLHPDEEYLIGTDKIPVFDESDIESLENAETIKELYEKVEKVRFERIVASADLLYNLANHLAEMKIINTIQNQLHEKELQLSDETRLRSQVEAALREADLKALQSQVNPHFLFNVLNTIGRLAAIEGATDTEEVVYQFADLMRYSLKRSSNDAVTIKDELDHVKNYLSIQKIRLGDRLWYDIHIDPDVGHLVCPSMIIQPFVENVINHVIEPRVAGGKVEISVLDRQDEVEIKISDNGNGISEEKAQGILNGTYTGDGKSTGLGIVNVNKRLKYYYGQEYGIKIGKSKEGGTEILMHLPKHNIEV